MLIGQTIIFAAIAALNVDGLAINNPVFVGEFTNIIHGIKGKVYIIDEQTLLIRGFEYDGQGPDAFFLAGTSGRRPSAKGTILPYPSNGRFYSYGDKSVPLLENEFKGDEQIELKLPKGMKTTDLKWLSVWCRLFNMDFGNVVFPKTIELEQLFEDSVEGEPIPEGYPEPGLDSYQEAIPEGIPEVHG